MKFKVTKYIAGKPVSNYEHHNSVQVVRDILNTELHSNNFVYAFEETLQQNEKIVFSLRDKQFKIIIEYRQL